MNTRSILILSAIAFGSTLLSNVAVAQATLKEQLIGIWMLVSNDNVAPDGMKREPFGSNPKGVLMLQANGHYAQVFTRPARPKFKSNNRLTGTPEEIKAAWDGALAHFGTWSVIEADKTVLLRVDGSFYPNQEGSEDKRLVERVSAEELKFVNAASTAGGRTEAVFRRIK
jgi:hypothetical protein